MIKKSYSFLLNTLTHDPDKQLHSTFQPQIYLPNIYEVQIPGHGYLSLAKFSSVSLVSETFYSGKKNQAESGINHEKKSLC